MFQEVLQEMVDGVEGSVGALLMGYDGIAVDQYIPANDGGVVETVGLEYSVILKEIRRAAETLEAGDTNEVAVYAKNLTAVLRPLNQDYFVAFALSPTANAGKARFLLRMAAPKLLDALS